MKEEIIKCPYKIGDVVEFLPSGNEIGKAWYAARFSGRIGVIEKITPPPDGKGYEYIWIAGDDQGYPWFSFFLPDRLSLFFILYAVIGWQVRRSTLVDTRNLFHSEYDTKIPDLAETRAYKQRMDEVRSKVESWLKPTNPREEKVKNLLLDLLDKGEIFRNVIEGYSKRKEKVTNIVANLPEGFLLEMEDIFDEAERLAYEDPYGEKS